MDTSNRSHTCMGRTRQAENQRVCQRSRLPSCKHLHCALQSQMGSHCETGAKHWARRRSCSSKQGENRGEGRKKEQKSRKIQHKHKSTQRNMNATIMCVAVYRWLQRKPRRRSAKLRKRRWVPTAEAQSYKQDALWLARRPYVARFSTCE